MLVVSLQICGLVCASAGLVTNIKTKPNAKVAFWTLAYTFTNLALLAQ